MANKKSVNKSSFLRKVLGLNAENQFLTGCAAEWQDYSNAMTRLAESLVGED